MVYRKRYMPHKRSKSAQDKRKAKLEQRVGQAAKSRLKSKLSDLRAKAKGLSHVEKLLVVASLNAIIADSRATWTEASNLRDRILRGRL